MNQHALLHRFGGHVLLVGVAGALLLGAQSLTSPPTADEAPVAQLATAPAGATAVAPAPLVAAGTPAPSPAAVDVAALPIVPDSRLAPAPNPRTLKARLPNHSFTQYEVRRGDTPNVIANRFGIKPETLLGGNPSLSDESNLLQAGALLTILPIDGVLHTIRRGETLEGIAEQYDVAVADIVAFESNNLAFPFRLEPGTALLIPGAAPRVFTWNPPEYPVGNFTVVGTGTYIWPVRGGCMSNAYWYAHPAIDVALPIGTSVVAMDTGTVTYASWASGGYYDYGNLVVVNHGNGFQTLYAHLSVINVVPGQVVTKGDRIAATGNSGRSSGPHIHIEIRANNVPDNPSFYLPGGYRAC